MAAPGEVYKRASMEEHDRRMVEKWTAHWQTVSDEILEAAAELLEAKTERRRVRGYYLAGGRGDVSTLTSRLEKVERAGSVGETCEACALLETFVSRLAPKLEE